MTRRRRGAAGLAIATALLLTLSAPPPASAAEGDLVVTIAQPGDGATLADSTVTVSGTVDTRPGLSLLRTTVTRIVVRLVPLREGGGGPIEIEVCRSCGGTPRPFSTSVTLARNGPYRAEATAEGRGELLGVGFTSVGGAGRSGQFGVAARPRPPQNVKVDVSPERVATVSWDRNPEPDMLHYAVFRKDPGSDKFLRVGGDVKHPTSGRASYVDHGTAGAGGDYAYQVVAVRRGADDGTMRSGPSAERKIGVAAPPPASDPGAGGPAPAPGGPGAAVAVTPRADISAFLASRSGPSLPAPPRVLELPDTGFSESLPFGSLPAVEELEEGEAEAEPRSFEVETRSSEFVSRGRPLVPVAGGAVLLLLAVHLRLLNRRIKDAPVPGTVSGPAHTDLTPLDLPTAPTAAPASGRDRPADESSPGERPAPPSGGEPAHPLLFDYEAVVEPADDREWAEREWDEDEVREVVVSPR